jgi:hypothetical protein
MVEVLAGMVVVAVLLAAGWLAFVAVVVKVWGD